jgi:hypothetical protein
MATLTRPKLASRPATSPLLTSAVPAPFPREQLHQEQQLNQQPSAQLDVEVGSSNIEAVNVKVSTAQGVLVR